MKRRKIIIIVFCLGILTGVLGGGLLYSQKALIGKAIRKIEYYRIESIPKKKNVFVLNDFANQKDLDLFRSPSADMSLSTDHVLSGTHSAKVVLMPSNGVSGLILKDSFKKKSFYNWEGYESFAVDVFNPQDKELSLIFKVKDYKGRNYQEKISLRPNMMNNVFINIPQLR